MPLKLALSLSLASFALPILSGCTARSTPSDTTLVSSGAPSGSMVALKTADQIWNTFMVLTGVSPSDVGNSVESNAVGHISAFIGVYDKLKPQLPGTNDPTAFAPGQQVAITKLAALFCDKLVVISASNSALAEPVFGSLNLGVAANQSLNTPEKRVALASALLERFWGPAEQERLPSRSEAITDLASVVEEIYLNAGSSSQAGLAGITLTKNLAKSACTAALASLPVVLQ
jgi:hypothetical protein